MACVCISAECFWSAPSSIECASYVYKKTACISAIYIKPNVAWMHRLQWNVQPMYKKGLCEHYTNNTTSRDSISSVVVLCL